jgi:hypothetical protein
MDKAAINEKFNRLNLLLQGDESLQHLNTQMSTRLNARKKVSTPGLNDEETKVSTLEPTLTASQLSKGYMS